ncbi:EamA family transporter RarD [Roseovarius faecimaris]|uniref:EamA family transporter RarD n=1 Tax=Roseovarius faecimaris TaxID=2494550 RepID=A0A6I6ISA9_9RHOB|nr:EamA family transporter RarD [Roseovarius faecimaris]QGX98783.1 EamA family transporter RarD [Roseovarius faecimaris]
MTDTTKGVLAMILACVLWGISGLFYNYLTHIPAVEVMAHRTVWAVVFFLVLLTLQRRPSAPFRALSTRRSFGILAVAMVLVGINWLVFVYAIQQGKALEASLGYFIYPLVAVALGIVVFAERVGRAQGLAIGLVTAAVLLLSIGLGVTPWLALLLAVSFGLYGMVKKGLAVGPVVSVTAEAMLLSPFALGFLAWQHGTGAGAFGANLQDSVLLALSGPITALPLMFFSYAAQRVGMMTVGLLSYLNPTLQFLVATLVLQEPFGLWHAIAFAMIWTALALYSAASWRQSKAARRPV